MFNNNMHPRCDMTADCPNDPTYLDEDGFIYCTGHGLDRQTGGWKRCRKMRPHEVNRLARGETIARY